MNSEYDIVIIEDNPNDSELMIRSLKKHHFINSFKLLEDGQDAMDFIFCKGKFADRNPAIKPLVIFLDLKLPKIGGLEILKSIKSNEHTKNIPVVIITSSKEDPDIEAAYNYGVNSYVVKPVDFQKFIETMRNLGMYWMLINEKPV